MDTIESALPSDFGASMAQQSPQMPPSTPPMAQSGATSSQPTQTSSIGQNASGQGSIPQYITKDQIRTFLQHIPQGTDPGTVLKNLTDNGHIIEGVNDQKFNLQQGNSANSTNDTSSQSQGLFGNIGSALGNFGYGLIKGFGRQIQAAGNFIANPINRLLGMNPDTSPENLAATQQFKSQGTAQNIGGGVADLATAVGAGMTGEGLVGELAQGAGYTGKALTVAKALGTGAGIGTEAFGTTNGKLGERVNQGLGQGTAATVGSLVLGPILSKVIGKGGNAAAVDAAGNVIKSTSDYWDAATNKLVTSAKNLSPDVTINLAKGDDQVTSKIIQKLADSGLPQEVLDRATGDMNTEDIQVISSNLNRMTSQMRDGANKDALTTLNSQFRGWAQKALNNAKPGEEIGNQMESLYSTAKSQYNTYDSLDKILKGNLSSGDSSALIKQVTAMGKDPNDRIILQNALQDYFKSSGTDFGNEIKSMQYVNKLKPAAKAGLNLLLKGAGFGSVYEFAKHFGL